MNIFLTPADVLAQNNCDNLVTSHTYYNNRHNDIKKLQQCLRELGFFKYSSNTGFYGPITKKAFEDFKSSQNLSTTNDDSINCKGRINDQTRYGMVNNNIKLLQDCLRKLGFFAYTSTGYFGPITRSALDKHNVLQTSISAINYESRINEFYIKYSGKRIPDPNGYLSGECVSLVKQWQKFIGQEFGFWPGDTPVTALQAYKNGNRTMALSSFKSKVEFIGDINQVKPGDILVFGTPYGNHTGIATGKYINGWIEMIEQNNPAEKGITQKQLMNQNSFKGALSYRSIL
ncbi:MAG: peptidoglycan-binding protein [Patescibacteria group bacterium]